MAEASQCRICRDPRRDQTILCVVEEPKDVVAVERTRGVPWPVPRARRGDQPDRRRGTSRPQDQELCLRLADGTVTEVILATDPNLEEKPPLPISAGCWFRSE